MVNLFPREVPRVLNLFPRELIEGTPKDFLKANLRPHQRQDPRPKTRGVAGLRVFSQGSGSPGTMGLFPIH